LLSHPNRIGISRNLAAQDLTPVVPDEEKPVQNPKGERWHGEKVLRRDGLAMVSEDVSSRTFGRKGVSSALFSVSRARILEQAKTELPPNTVQLRHTGVTMGSGFL
jgi:hypothetical protein